MSDPTWFHSGREKINSKVGSSGWDIDGVFDSTLEDQYTLILHPDLLVSVHPWRGCYYHDPLQLSLLKKKRFPSCFNTCRSGTSWCLTLILGSWSIPWIVDDWLSSWGVVDLPWWGSSLRRVRSAQWQYTTFEHQLWGGCHALYRHRVGALRRWHYVGLGMIHNVNNPLNFLK